MAVRLPVECTPLTFFLLGNCVVCCKSCRELREEDYAFEEFARYRVDGDLLLAVAQ